MNLREAVANLIKVKGRHNTEIAYQQLIEAFDADKPREWVNLTDDEIRIAWGPYFSRGVDVARVIEALLKKRNT